MKAIYEVQVVNRNTGAEHWARVEADNAESARSKVIGLGEIVGEVRLAEVLGSAAPVPAPSIPGIVTCPSCKGQVWEGGRGCFVRTLVILLFPLGLLLLLFIMPTWRCMSCGYRFQSFTVPAVPGEGTQNDRNLAGCIYIFLVMFALILAAVAFGVYFKP
jgi:hypothetical protein